MKARVVMDRAEFASTLSRLASEIEAKTRGVEEELALVGIRTRSVPLARRLAERIEAKTGRKPAIGALDITLYRDDLTTVGSQPIVRATELPFSMDDAWVVLVDDVLFTGRTVRAAITALIDFGRPRKIELLAMVDRGSLHAVGTPAEVITYQAIRQVFDTDVYVDLNDLTGSLNVLPLPTSGRRRKT